MRSQYVIGIDLGGTNVKCGLVSLEGSVISQTHLATESFIADKNQLIRALCEACFNLLHKNHLENKEKIIHQINNFAKGQKVTTLKFD